MIKPAIGMYHEQVLTQARKHTSTQTCHLEAEAVLERLMLLICNSRTKITKRDTILKWQFYLNDFVVPLSCEYCHLQFRMYHLCRNSNLACRHIQFSNLSKKNIQKWYIVNIVYWYNVSVQGIRYYIQNIRTWWVNMIVFIYMMIFFTVLVCPLIWMLSENKLVMVSKKTRIFRELAG